MPLFSGGNNSSITPAAAVSYYSLGSPQDRLVCSLYNAPQTWMTSKSLLQGS